MAKSNHTNESVYKILKKQEITNHLVAAGTFREEENYGYWFRLSDGRHGKIFLNRKSTIEWNS